MLKALTNLWHQNRKVNANIKPLARDMEKFGEKSGRKNVWKI